MYHSVRATMSGLLLLTLCACSGGQAQESTDAATATSAAPTPESSPAAEVDYRKNTKQVCGKVEGLLEGKELEQFAENLGQQIVYRKAKQTAKAKRAQVAAKKELRNLAAVMRRTTTSAQDPGLKAAGKEAAIEIEKSADDDAFFAKLTSIKNINKYLESEMTAWLTPIALYCA